ncbi:NmrA family NAD(P)-binding protein [Nostocoides australiense]|nr:NmrA family NAD(P)-binding protein [Actinomycetota bacterium]MCB1301693.1 NmrA family NAD(P)-binding protein [Tetrasphaera sp.]HPF81329.1 NmrA family NAD(P)-binding protein [Tetrasphaera australiensis]
MTEVLVTGAAGKTGRAVTKALVCRGARVRCAVRPGSSTPIHEDAAARRVPVDLATGEGLGVALAGVDAVYVIAPNVNAREVEMVRHIADAAVAAGIPRVVYHSVMHPDDTAMPHHLRKHEAEKLLREKPFGLTILRPAAYHQNLRPAALAGEIAVPYSLDVPFTNVDLDDIAQVAATAVLTRELDHAAYDLAGPQELSVRELAAIAADVLGRPVRATQISREEWLAGPGAALAPQPRADLLAMFTAYDREGFAGDSTILPRLLGGAPSTWENVLSVA